ncbi:TonB-dependent receptor [Sphingomonas baiyangensis]|uniref:TonB-dependent receptor n=1 Tax=Sphingomonas baiyangensis TaxID=2572576 RepID=A0A4U1L671_9SPHN|nr:TonB-dependent receptor [Sphingomonas baiyangensis]TKD51823.1 TonB-dependent receptor [Sphingomonas baiyangensis]
MALRTRIRAPFAGASTLALALSMSIAAPALAQDADPVQEESEAGDDIVVTGFRQSLENAINAKKLRDQVVESISAEDIGRLPDASIAESIARLPGLTSQRVSGRSNAISIRGFAPDFSTTLLNGREQTSTGDNRAVEYDQYPAEVINQVLVYKTPMASLIGQGLSGTVDLRTIRPLEFGKSTITLTGRGIYTDLGKLNAESNEFGYRVNGVYVDQFFDDTLGVALSASYVDEPYQIQEFNAWGYAGTPQGNVIGGSKSYVTSTALKRLGLQGTVQWQPTPNFTITADGFYSDFEDNQIKRGIELPLAFNGNVTLTGAQTTDGLVTSGTFNNVEGVVRNDLFERAAKLYSGGLNVKWEGDDGWNVYGDLSFSKTDRNELVLESNAGTGRGEGVGATDTIGFVTGPRGTVFSPRLNYADYNLIRLTSPLGWGGNQTSVDGRQILNGQDGYYNNRIIVDEIRQYRGEVEKELEGFLRSVQFGLNFTQRTKQLTPDEAFLGLVANTDGQTSVVIPEQFRQPTTSLDYLGLGPMVSYNPLDLLNAGIYQLVPNPFGDVVVKAYDIQEEQMTAYLQANIDQDIGTAQLTGNVGAQVIFTDQNSNGATARFAGNLPNGAPIIVGDPRRESTNYVDFLPSANLSLRTASDFVIRLSAAREIIRPRLDDLRASLSFGFEIINNVATVTGSSGNPDLRPWRANAVDLTFEKYFGSSGYLAAQFFYKDLQSYIYNTDVQFPIAGIPLEQPGAGIVIAPIGRLNIPVNGEGGNLYGVELAGTLPFNVITPALDGFGITGGVSYTESQLAPAPGAPEDDIPGYSKWVANGTAFFEKWGFNIRGSVRYRSSFVGELSGFGAARVRRRALGETIVDGQIGYDFQPGSALEGVALFLQGQNLTDERFATVNPGNELEVIDYQIYGRRFLAGATIRF